MSEFVVMLIWTSFRFFFPGSTWWTWWPRSSWTTWQIGKKPSLATSEIFMWRQYKRKTFNDIDAGLQRDGEIYSVMQHRGNERERRTWANPGTRPATAFICDFKLCVTVFLGKIRSSRSSGWVGPAWTEGRSWVGRITRRAWTIWTSRKTRSCYSLGRRINKIEFNHLSVINSRQKFTVTR